MLQLLIPNKKDSQNPRRFLDNTFNKKQTKTMGFIPCFWALKQKQSITDLVRECS